jgi:CDP-glucose 4,6-dehydratase
MDHLVKALELFRGKRVFLTGDTGFKGSWLALWLAEAGAEVYGYALPPVADDAHFNLLRLSERICHEDGDIRNLEQLKLFFNKAQPEFVFHLAAQALVHRSYHDPKETFDTNMGGSVNLLECIRASETVRSLVYITSDKCYRNNEWIWGYRENDALGGPDPYSASKAAAELIFSAYGTSYFQFRDNLGYASVRAGNVIGGGDWSDNRIVPDCIRALQNNVSITLRKPEATRPWQHVLEPLSGYITLAAKLSSNPQRYSGAWNFGPNGDTSRSVLDVAELIVKQWGHGHVEVEQLNETLHEAGLLGLNCDKAHQLLAWAPRWGFERTLVETVDWYKALFQSESAAEVSSMQIKRYMES